MKSALSLLALSLASSLAIADQLSVSNPVTRSLTLQDGEFSVSAGLLRVQKNDRDEKYALGLGGGYGITDNVTLGLGQIRYNFMPREYNGYGLELAVEGGLLGYYRSSVLRDGALAWGGALLGKYVVDDRLAYTFGTRYVYWDVEDFRNQQSIGVEGGVIYRFADTLSGTAELGYRKLHNFSRDDDFRLSVGLIWNVTDQTDINLGYSHTTYDNNYRNSDNGAGYANYAGDSVYEHLFSLGVTYRF